MHGSDVRVRAIIRAAEVLGGVPAVAKYLRASPASVEEWLAGYVPIPDMVFLRLVDVLLDELSCTEPVGVVWDGHELSFADYNGAARRLLPRG